MDGHVDHTLYQLEDVNAQYSETLRNLLSQTKPLVATLNESIKNVEFTVGNVQEQARVVANEICGTIDDQMKALQEHKRTLLNQLEAIRQHKYNTLQLQLEDLRKTLDTATANCSLAQTALREKKAFSAFSTKTQVVSHLEEVLSTKHELMPKEDDYIRFNCEEPAGKVRGFELVGILESKGPSASHTIVEGAGLYEARMDTVSSFSVAVHDRYGERRGSGGEKVEAFLTNFVGTRLRTLVNDRGDGTYHVTYTPKTIGEHRLSVLVCGKHVKASPFIINVLPKRNQHFGVYHCCTFCSTKGKKHVRCGCGGTMPVGYSGCGHGHPGHPGCWHWSCCGTSEKESECLV